MSDKITTVSELREIIENFSDARGWGKSQNPKNLAISLSLEASEVLEIFQWVDTENAHEIKNNPEKFQHLKEEVADVFWYLTNLCDHFDIDLTEAVKDKERKNALRFPVDK